MLEEYKIKRYAEENVIIMDTIRIIMPSYDKKKRRRPPPTKQKKFFKL